ncbi:MAG: response regulator [Cyclobacteriaceae bacterium]|nr:response regulator [Cyclobacteriaceae bacterium SS2]
MKVNSILLVDDNAATNLVHRKMITKNLITENVFVCKTGEDAIDFLNRCNNESDISAKAKNMPDLVLLDINMPGMSGWDFIQEYKKISFTGYEPMIFMLTTSFNPDDRFKADGSEYVQGFINKPLTAETLKRVVNIYFTEKLLNS